MAVNNSEMRIKRLPRSQPVDRHGFILSLCAGKAVLDLGCADHPVTEERYHDGELLFAKLHEVARRLVGVDASREGMETLRALGFSEVVLGNASRLGELELEISPEVIVAGELLEHITDTDGFFRGVTALMSPGTLLAISVPNAYALKRFLRVMCGSELVNREHVCSFSQANVEELCRRHGLGIVETRYYLAEVEGTMKRLLLAPLMFFIRYLCPQASDHLIFVCRKQDGR